MEEPFRHPLPHGLKLIETFRHEPGTGFVRIEAHLARMARSAARLGLPWPEAEVREALAAHAGAAPLRVRLTLSAEGAVEVSAAPLPPPAERWSVTIAAERVDAADPWLSVKTTQRALYDRVRAALPAGVDEAVFLNTRGEVAEGAITNVFVERDGVLLTPPVASGALPGILRETLLARGEAREAVLSPEDLGAGPLFVGNSTRGLIPAVPVARPQ